MGKEPVPAGSGWAGKKVASPPRMAGALLDRLFEPPEPYRQYVEIGYWAEGEPERAPLSNSTPELSNGSRPSFVCSTPVTW